MGILVAAIAHILSDTKDCRCAWGLVQVSTPQEVQAEVWVALSLGPNDPVHCMVLEVSVVGKDAGWILWQAPVGESQFRALGIGARPCSLQERIICL